MTDSASTAASSFGPARILGIETSCDETAAAVVEDGRVILSNEVASQVDLHARFGGVFPEVASRQHIRTIFPICEIALQQAHLELDELDAIAVTRGPGLPRFARDRDQHGKGVGAQQRAPLNRHPSSGSAHLFSLAAMAPSQSER
ncbi:MAG: hypothetical protein M5U05_05475 [Anaerolineales bacterium]|nr:hypothetical protein [Anaerolineales bacterium]